MRVRRIAWIGTLVGAIPLLALAAGEPGPQGPQAARGACRADVQRLCGDVQPGSGGRRECLRQHQSELSPQCQERIGQMRQRVAQLREACGGDVQRLCSGVQRGHGAVARCMREHESELSSQCREGMPQRGARQTPSD